MKSRTEFYDNLLISRQNNFNLSSTNIFKKHLIFTFQKSLYNNSAKIKKKNYTKLLFYKLITLINTLNTILKSIVFKRICYAIETLKIFLNTQMSVYK